MPSGCIQTMSEAGMARKSKSSKPKASTQSNELKGWQQIAAFLGQPASVVQRWASEGMPLRCNYTRRTQRMARERIRQACACCNGGHRFNRRVETRTLVYPVRKTIETAKEE